MPNTHETGCHQQRRVAGHASRLHAYDLFNLLTGDALLDAAIGPYSGKTESEHALFPQLLGSISANDLILADRYDCAYFVIALIRAQGADVLFQQHQRRHTDFRKGRRLGARDPVVAWPKPKIRPGWMTREQYDAFPATLEIREVKIKSRVRVTTLCMA